MTQLTPRPLVGRILAIGIVAIGSAGAVWPAAHGDTDMLRITPDTAEHRYQACIEGAPTTADAFEHWSLDCHQRVAAGRM